MLANLCECVRRALAKLETMHIDGWTQGQMHARFSEVTNETQAPHGAACK